MNCCQRLAKPTWLRSGLITHNIGTRVLLGKHSASTVGGDYEIRDDGNGLDLLGPVELDVVSNAVRGRGRLLASIDTAGRCGQHLTQGDLCSRNVLRRERLEVGSDKASVQGGADIVRVPFCRYTY